MDDEEITLVVDSNDTYQDKLDIFYIHPKRLSLLKLVNSKEFSKATIQYSPIENLTSLNFSYILRTLNYNSICEVTVHQLISVMQDYDAKQIEANAKLAGFVNFQYSKVELENPTNKNKYNSILVSFQKPAKVEKEESSEKSSKALVDVKVNQKDKNKLNVKDSYKVSNVRQTSNSKKK